MLRVLVRNDRQDLSFEHPNGTLEFGRAAGTAGDRCVVEDLSVSRDQLRIRELPESRVRIENLSRQVAVLLVAGGEIAPGGQRDVPLPADLRMGKTEVRLEPLARLPVETPSATDVLATVAKPIEDFAELADLRARLSGNDAPDTETLTRWFETLVGVLQSAATSAEFYARAAQGVVDLVGLDEGLVLVREGLRWKVAARFGIEDADGESYSQRILDFVVNERRTFFSELHELDPTASLANVSAAVASPILGIGGEHVVGVVYGRRGMESAMGVAPLRPLEAQLVQVLASAVAAGLQRMEMAAEASRWRVQLESFFTPRLVEELDRNPRMLEASEREVTIAFADLRGFTDATARLGAVDACRVVGNAMDHLSVIVHRHDGVIVDYYGDGLVAMWNAPVDQHDHANRAVNAALDMLAELPTFGEEWLQLLGRPLQIGVGINSGPAIVGNVGSKRKFKYGALGLTVNLTQRIETVTKLVGFPVLCSGTTAGSVHTRARLIRVGPCLLSGALVPVDLHVVLPKRDESFSPGTQNVYAAALEMFEAGDWERAASIVTAEPDLAERPIGRLLVKRSEGLAAQGATAADAALDLRTK